MPVLPYLLAAVADAPCTTRLRTSPAPFLAAVLFAVAAVTPAAWAQEARAFETVTFQSLDGLPVHADLYETGDRRDPLVLLFHQSASSRGEFRGIAPGLVDLGFNALAVDLRWGATDRWSRVVNETARAHGTAAIMADAEAGRRERVWPTIFAAYEDMLAAVDWAAAQGFSGRTLALGSSFSSILVLRLPQDRALDAVMAYSPGEYHEGDSTLVRTWARRLDTPALIVAAPGEEALVGPVYEAVRTPHKTLFVAPAGRHGASILLDDPGNRDHLRAFLEPYRPPREVSFQAGDGVTVYGDLYADADDREAPVLLLFHQGGGNARGEYEPLVPRLRAAGYTVLAIDQRRGGSRLGGINRTVEALGAADGSYCDAYPDLEAALAFMVGEGYGGPYVFWGSSYSAALAMRLAAAHPERARGVLAFSPAGGEPMAGCEPEPLAVELGVPVLVLRPAPEIQYPHVAAQLEHFRAHGLQTYVAPSGVHGSSMLNPQRVRGDVEATWAVVMRFLEQHLENGTHR